MPADHPINFLLTLMIYTFIIALIKRDKVFFFNTVTCFFIVFIFCFYISPISSVLDINIFSEKAMILKKIYTYAIELGSLKNIISIKNDGIIHENIFAELRTIIAFLLFYYFIDNSKKSKTIFFILCVFSIAFNLILIITLPKEINQIELASLIVMNIYYLCLVSFKEYFVNLENMIKCLIDFKNKTIKNINYKNYKYKIETIINHGNSYFLIIIIAITILTLSTDDFPYKQAILAILGLLISLQNSLMCKCFYIKKERKTFLIIMLISHIFLGFYLLDEINFSDSFLIILAVIVHLSLMNTKKLNTKNI